MSTYIYSYIAIFINPYVDIFIYVCLHICPSIEREFKDNTTLGSAGLIYGLITLELIQYYKVHTFTDKKNKTKK